MITLVLISYNSELKKIQNHNTIVMYTIIRKMWFDISKILLSFSLEYNFSFVDLKYSVKLMTPKSFTSLSVKIFK